MLPIDKHCHRYYLEIMGNSLRKENYLKNSPYSSIFIKTEAPFERIISHLLKPVLIEGIKICWKQRVGRTLKVRIANISRASFDLWNRISAHWKRRVVWFLPYHAHFFFQLQKLLLVVFSSNGFICLEKIIKQHTQLAPPIEACMDSQHYHWWEGNACTVRYS